MAELERIIIAFAINRVAQGLLADTPSCLKDARRRLGELILDLASLERTEGAVGAPEVTAWDDPFWPPGSEVN